MQLLSKAIETGLEESFFACSHMSSFQPYSVYFAKFPEITHALRAGIKEYLEKVPC